MYPLLFSAAAEEEAEAAQVAPLTLTPNHHPKPEP